MDGCLSSSLFLSEVLIIISSCVFVVMAVLTAVISVTNIAFSGGDDTDLFERHCQLPHKFVVSESYDTLYEPYISPYSAVVALLKADLRSTLVNRSILQKDRVLDRPNIDEELRVKVNTALKNYSQTTLADNVPFNLIPSLFRAGGALSTGKLTMTNPLTRFEYSIVRSSSAYHWQTIKDLLHSAGHPILISLADLGEVDDKGVIGNGNSVETYLVYGWNDDFAGGGLIVKQAASVRVGHSIPYFYGSISNTDERVNCPCPGLLAALPVVASQSDFDDMNALACKNGSVCDTKTVYRMRTRPGTTREPWIDEKSSVVEAHVFAGEKEGTISAESVNEILNAVMLEAASQPNDACSYWFLPYARIAAATGDSMTNNGSVIAYDITIDWNNVKDLTDACCRESSVPMAARPTPGAL